MNKLRNYHSYPTVRQWNNAINKNFICAYIYTFAKTRIILRYILRLLPYKITSIYSFSMYWEILIITSFIHHHSECSLIWIGKWHCKCFIQKKFINSSEIKTCCIGFEIMIWCFNCFFFPFQNTFFSPFTIHIYLFIHESVKGPICMVTMENNIFFLNLIMIINYTSVDLK